MLEEIHAQCPSPESIFNVLVGKTFINTFVKVMGEMLEFCMWYGCFVKCVVLSLCIQSNLHANLRQ
jgi:hypothetical protein